MDISSSYRCNQMSEKTHRNQIIGINVADTHRRHDYECRSIWREMTRFRLPATRPSRARPMKSVDELVIDINDLENANRRWGRRSESWHVRTALVAGTLAKVEKHVWASSFVHISGSNTALWTTVRFLHVMILHLLREISPGVFRARGKPVGAS